MKDFLTALLEFINKYGYNFIISCLLTCLTIYILYITKYPYIFRLWEFQEGRIKFLIFLCAIFSLYLLLCYFGKIIKEKIDSIIQINKNDNNIIQNVQMMLNNAETYEIELYVLTMLTGNDIKHFDIDTLLKIHKKLNPEIVHVSRFRNCFQEAVWNLKNLKIVEIKGYNFYSVKDKLFDAIVKELKNGYSK